MLLRPSAFSVRSRALSLQLFSPLSVRTQTLLGVSFRDGFPR